MEVPKGVVIEEATEPIPVENQSVESMRLEYACGHICTVTVWAHLPRRMIQLVKLSKIPCPACQDSGWKKPIK